MLTEEGKEIVVTETEELSWPLVFQKIFQQIDQHLLQLLSMYGS